MQNSLCFLNSILPLNVEILQAPETKLEWFKTQKN